MMKQITDTTWNTTQLSFPMGPNRLSSMTVMINTNKIIAEPGDSCLYVANILKDKLNLTECL